MARNPTIVVVRDALICVSSFLGWERVSQESWGLSIVHADAECLFVVIYKHSDGVGRCIVHRYFGEVSRVEQLRAGHCRF